MTGILQGGEVVHAGCRVSEIPGPEGDQSAPVLLAEIGKADRLVLAVGRRESKVGNGRRDQVYGLIDKLSATVIGPNSEANGITRAYSGKCVPDIRIAGQDNGLRGPIPEIPVPFGNIAGKPDRDIRLIGEQNRIELAVGGIPGEVRYRQRIYTDTMGYGILASMLIGHREGGRVVTGCSI